MVIYRQTRFNIVSPTTLHMGLLLKGLFSSSSGLLITPFLPHSVLALHSSRPISSRVQLHGRWQWREVFNQLHTHPWGTVSRLHGPHPSPCIFLTIPYQSLFEGHVVSRTKDIVRRNADHPGHTTNLPIKPQHERPLSAASVGDLVSVV